MVLTDNVIASYWVTSQADCLFYCYENKKCLSYNYEYSLSYNNEGKLGLCELNNKTMSSCPLRKAMVIKEGHGYFDEMNVVEKKVYGSEQNPGTSCLDISSCHDNDGEYWLASEQTSWVTMRVFCYIKQDPSTINLAQNKPVIQTTTGSGGVAERAVDGIRSSNWGQGSCTHTHTNSPWWRVDLQHVFFIRKLIITNRSDCCPERLSNFEIRIGATLNNTDGNSNPLCGGYHSLKAETKSIVCPNPMIGRYVNIIIPGPGKHLTLCEVEVYA
ncbi:fucolectin-like isoform X2 [Dendronephthya gigantea]|nr:fucolectin-like isoform X2 [Dendronephthya gigantea]